MDQLYLQLKARASKQRGQKFATARTQRGWWAPVWRGLPVEPTGKHYRRMHCSLWLYLYLVIHANRKTGTLHRVVGTIASDMGISSRTIRLWLSRLKKHLYIETNPTGRALKISITKWKAVRKKPD
jgi:hypothetical protein